MASPENCLVHHGTYHLESSIENVLLLDNFKGSPFFMIHFVFPILPNMVHSMQRTLANFLSKLTKDSQFLKNPKFKYRPSSLRL